MCAISTIYVLALVAVIRPSTGATTLGRRATYTLAVLITARFYLPLALVGWRTHETNDAGRLSASLSPKPVAFLRELSAAQEQYRLRQGTYSSSAEALRSVAPLADADDVRIVANGDRGWSAHVFELTSECSIWVRDVQNRDAHSGAEGSPYCGTDELRAQHQAVLTVRSVASDQLLHFRASDAAGQWMQHRANAERTGIVIGGDSLVPRTWTVHVGAELRASAAVAGNQVFVGGHGNGEFVALFLNSGAVGWRLRAPNWVHHEPVVTQALVIVGFGNNEESGITPGINGSEPSGVVAYDRLSGVERWRRYTRGSVMTSPVLFDSLVAVVTGAGDVIAWRSRDGAEVWRTQLPGTAQMANPLLRDSTVFVALEKATVCALNVRTGATIFCRRLSRDVTLDASEAGHSSPTAAGAFVLATYNEESRSASA